MFRPAVMIMPYFTAASVSVFSPLIPGYWTAAEEKPNIVVIMANDLSSDMTSVLLENGRLPNLQTHLLDNGVRFTHAFVTSTTDCPSRVSYLTGQYSHNTNVLADNAPEPGKDCIHWQGWLPTESYPGRNGSTIATWLHAKGYYTGYIGKYLNGYGSVTQPDVPSSLTYIPPGWDDWQGLIDPFSNSVYNYYLNDNGTIVNFEKDDANYQTDVLAQRAMRFIADAALHEQPFFLTVSPLAPHVETDGAKQVESISENDFSKRFKARIRPASRHRHLNDNDLNNGEMAPLPKNLSFNEKDLSDKPSCSRTKPLYGVTITFDPFCVGDTKFLNSQDIANVEAQFKSMAASMLALDDMVGNIINVLTDNGLRENTIIIFTSDNGWMFGEHATSGKGLPYEEVIRVPLFIYDPRQEVSGIADQLVLNTDLAPTIAELAGIIPPYQCDGKSLVPLLTDPDNKEWHRKSFLIEHFFFPGLAKYNYPTTFAIRHRSDDGEFLFVTTYANPEDPEQATSHEFYDIQNDPSQLNSMPLPENVIASLEEYLLNLRLSKGSSTHYLESF